jgi:hypothetical protein
MKVSKKSSMNIDLPAHKAILEVLTPQELAVEYTRATGEAPLLNDAAMIDRLLIAPRRKPEPSEDN